MVALRESGLYSLCYVASDLRCAYGVLKLSTLGPPPLVLFDVRKPCSANMMNSSRRIIGHSGKLLLTPTLLHFFINLFLDPFCRMLLKRTLLRNTST